MSVQDRMRMCQLIDRMEIHMEYCKRLGLENISSFHGCKVENVIEKKRGSEQ